VCVAEATAPTITSDSLKNVLTKFFATTARLGQVDNKRFLVAQINKRESFLKVVPSFN